MHMSVKNRNEIILRKRPGQPESTEVMSPTKTWCVLENLKHFLLLLQLTEGRIGDMIVEFAVASDFSEKQSHSRNADHGQRGHRIFDFSPYLILQITISNIFLICNKINKNEEKKWNQCGEFLLLTLMGKIIKAHFKQSSLGAKKTKIYLTQP